MNVTGLPRNRGVNADWVNDAYLMAGTLGGKGVWLVESDEQNVWWVIVRERGGEFVWEDEVTTASLQGEWEKVRLELLATVPEEWMEGIKATPFVHDPAAFRDHELEGAARAVVECWSSGDLAASVRALSRVLDRRAAGETGGTK